MAARRGGDGNGNKAYQISAVTENHCRQRRRTNRKAVVLMEEVQEEESRDERSQKQCLLPSADHAVVSSENSHSRLKKRQGIKVNHFHGICNTRQNSSERGRERSATQYRSDHLPRLNPVSEYLSRTPTSVVPHVYMSVILPFLAGCPGFWISLTKTKQGRNEIIYQAVGAGPEGRLLNKRWRFRNWCKGDATVTSRNRGENPGSGPPSELLPVPEQE